MADRRTRARAAKFGLADAIDVEIPEASDVAALPAGRFLVVSDLERSAALVGRDGRVKRIPLSDGDENESGFEAVAYDPRAGRLFVVSEERHELEIYAFRGAASSMPRLLARCPLPYRTSATKKERKKRKKKGRNKGVEGMAWLPATLSPTKKSQLVLAKEARPCALALLDPSGKGALREIVLDERIEQACNDFSGLAVDPTTGHLFLCSDESAAFAEIALRERRGELRAELLGATKLRDAKGRRMDRVEGITVDARGDLHVLLENARELWRLERK